jgi:hypothetical protein
VTYVSDVLDDVGAQQSVVPVHVVTHVEVVAAPAHALLLLHTSRLHHARAPSTGVSAARREVMASAKEEGRILTSRRAKTLISDHVMSTRQINIANHQAREVLLTRELTSEFIGFAFSVRTPASTRTARTRTALCPHDSIRRVCADNASATRMHDASLTAHNMESVATASFGIVGEPHDVCTSWRAVVFEKVSEV